MLVFLWREENRRPREKPSKQCENQQKPQPTYGIRPGSNRPRRRAFSPLRHPCSVLYHPLLCIAPSLRCIIISRRMSCLGTCNNYCLVITASSLVMQKDVLYPRQLNMAWHLLFFLFAKTPQSPSRLHLSLKHYWHCINIIGTCAKNVA